MATNTNPIFVKTVHNSPVAIVITDGTSKKDLITGTANGTNVRAITTCGTNTSDVDISVYLYQNGSDFLLGTVKIPALAGSVSTVGGVEMISAMTHLEGPIMLKLDEKIKVASTSVIDPDKFINIVALGGDY